MLTKATTLEKSVVLLCSPGHVHCHLGRRRWRDRFSSALWHGRSGQPEGTPWGTVVVNVLGALLLGTLVGIWGFRANDEVRIGVAVGLLGGFTTFSTFAIYVIHLWEHGNPAVAVSSVLVTLVAGLGAAVFGVAIGRAVT